MSKFKCTSFKEHGEMNYENVDKFPLNFSTNRSMNGKLNLKNYNSSVFEIDMKQWCFI